LLLAGEKDTAWPSSVSVKEIQTQIEAAGRSQKVCAHVYKNGSHFIGVMPDTKKYKRLNLMRLMSKHELLHPKACAKAQRQSESDVFEFLANS
jgi:heterodisulfide reductase subunit C